MKKRRMQVRKEQKKEARNMELICHELVKTSSPYGSCFICSFILKLIIRSLEIILKSKWIKGPDVAGRMTNQTDPG